jgi:hypothetical protein
MNQSGTWRFCYFVVYGHRELECSKPSDAFAFSQMNAIMLAALGTQFTVMDSWVHMHRIIILSSKLREIRLVGHAAFIGDIRNKYRLRNKTWRGETFLEARHRCENINVSLKYMLCDGILPVIWTFLLSSFSVCVWTKALECRSRMVINFIRGLSAK